MKPGTIRSFSSGANQSGVRAHNERLLLSMLQRTGPMPGSELARRAGLSPQTVSVILRKLEGDGFLQRLQSVRGKVGKPSVPMALKPGGLFSFGLKIGRRSSDLLLLDFCGGVRVQKQLTYAYPMPDAVFGFLRDGMAAIATDLEVADRARICGIGIAAPFELWNWHEQVGAPKQESLAWKDVDIEEEIQRFSDLPVFVVNDATAACRAEHMFGHGKVFRDYAYFFLGAFIGGGVVLNNSVFEGHRKNAGALGSIPDIGPDGRRAPLLEIASLHVLENRLVSAGIDRAAMWRQPQDWTAFEPLVEPWLRDTAQAIARAGLTACSVIDFEAVLIDGSMPPAIRTRLVQEVRAAMGDLDSRGLILPQVVEGVIGANARAIGAASGPVIAQFMLNTMSGLSDPSRA